MLGSFWDHVGVVLGYFLGHSRVVLGSFWNRFGSFWDGADGGIVLMRESFAQGSE